MKYVIEHMEDGFSNWVILEYSTIAKEIGAENLILSSVKATTKVPQELLDLGIIVTPLEVTNLKEIEPDFDISKVCLLDPSAKSALKCSDSSKFDYFLFGGILGDHPPRDRTGELRKLGFEGRHLDKVQMTTDTAVRVTDKVLNKNQELGDIEYIDFPQIKFSEHESVEMPFRYVKSSSNEPIMPNGMKELIYEDFDRSFDGF